MNKTLRLFATLAILLLPAGGAWADAALVGDKSGLRFISVKNAAVAEVHHFRNLSGSLADNGRVEVTVPLVDVETLIPIRNERMQKMLFETVKFPTATLEAEVDMSALKALGNGDYTGMQVTVTVDLHGSRKAYTTTVGVARLGDEIHVRTREPIVVNAADFELTAGVERLREVAGLSNISTAVPVTASFVFQL
jgi:polyisoprenoid-binding protein YceI